MLALVLVVAHSLVMINSVSDNGALIEKNETENFYQVQAQLYLNFLNSKSLKLNKQQRLIANVGNDLKDKDFGTISRVSLQDSYFDPLKAPTAGVDDVALEHWKKAYYRIQEATELSPAGLLGVRLNDLDINRWVLYMFVHADSYHLLSNLIFLLLFGALIETIFGGLMVIILFLGSGLIAIPVYMLLSVESSISLVGASGGVCGLLAFYSLYRFRSSMRFFFWVLPFEKYYGFVNLSAGVILCLWLAADLAGLLGTLPFMESVAHGAHIGGFIAGMSAATGVLCWEYFRDKYQLKHKTVKLAKI